MIPWLLDLRSELLQATYDFYGDKKIIEADEELHLSSLISLQKNQVGYFNGGRLVAVVWPEDNFGLNQRFLIIFLDGILIGSGKGGVFLSYFQFDNFYCKGNIITFLGEQKGWHGRKQGIRMEAEWFDYLKLGEYFIHCREKALPWRNELRKLQFSGYKRPSRLSEKWLWKKNERALKKTPSCSRLPATEEEWRRKKYLLKESEKRGRKEVTKLLDVYYGV
ncbi:MAG: hypothetical protein IJ274_03630 [Lachnospiraceae bacterium]|nr:hypothetical protein [Lachnospiraceae bacterium]